MTKVIIARPFARYIPITEQEWDAHRNNIASKNTSPEPDFTLQLISVSDNK
jgi:hypothetical protein